MDTPDPLVMSGGLDMRRCDSSGAADTMGDFSRGYVARALELGSLWKFGEGSLLLSWIWGTNPRATNLVDVQSHPQIQRS